MDRSHTIPQSAPFPQGGLILGITGGTGCGKTTLLRAVEDIGGLVLDCDAIYHELLLTDEAMLSAIARRFPGTVEGGRLQRQKLGAIVFSDEKALQDLNAITHSAVRKAVLERLSVCPGLAAIDAIGLFEGRLAELCDATVAVTAPESARIARLMARDSITEEYARLRIAAQKSNEEFSALCDYTLCNDGTEAAFREKCVAFLLDLAIMKP